MDKNIWTGNFKAINEEMKDNWAMKDDELAKFDAKLKNMSEMLQDFVDLKYNSDN